MKKAKVKNLLHLIDAGFCLSLVDSTPICHGKVQSKYTTIAMSWVKWSSEEVIYTHPPQATVRITPTVSNNFPNPLEEVLIERVVSQNQRKTSANRGPDVSAIKIWKMARAGYLSPVVALTLGNHSYRNYSKGQFLTFNSKKSCVQLASRIRQDIHKIRCEQSFHNG